MLSLKINGSIVGGLIASLILFIIPTSIKSQVQGCTDTAANNYNAAATSNDGSCTYNATNYSPALKVDPISDSLVESSGLQIAGNSLWSFNDGGGTATLYRIDTLSNALLQRVILQGAQNIDWEDISFDGTFFYIGDFGNNASGSRTDLKIYKFPLAAIPDYTTNPVAIITSNQIEVINFTYANQPQPPIASSPNNTKFDCEAMIVDNGMIHLFTKNWIDLTSTHYTINSINAGNYIVQPLETLNTGYLVTAADKAPTLNLILLLGYQNSGTANHFLHILTDYSNGHFFNGNKRKINLPDVTFMGQAEGIAFRNDTYGYISNEKFVYGGFINVKQKLRSFDISPFINSISGNYTFKGNGNWSDSINWQNETVPPLALVQGSQIIIDPIQNGQCLLDIPYTVEKGSIINVATGKSFLIQGNLIVQ